MFTKDNIIVGYKCFYSNLRTKINQKLVLNQILTSETEPKFHYSGFHFCKRLEDTLRFFELNSDSSNIEIGLVIGVAPINTYDDEYNGYYDMYSSKHLLINNILSREDIIEYAKKLKGYRLQRFLEQYNLNLEELIYFYNLILDNVSNYYMELQIINKKYLNNFLNINLIFDIWKCGCKEKAMKYIDECKKLNLETFYQDYVSRQIEKQKTKK